MDNFHINGPMTSEIWHLIGSS